MQISGASQAQPQFQQASSVQASRSEEATEVASSPREEASEAQSIVKSAEQDRGLGTKIDVFA